MYFPYHLMIVYFLNDPSHFLASRYRLMSVVIAWSKEMKSYLNSRVRS